ncbi:hypothetical protein JTB14_017906 [Gonioctena quinquepunctata]|nr:hypothetical protein JTB14_017906 [Gonioctena quinquepunctata]
MASTSNVPENDLPGRENKVPDWILAREGIKLVINGNCQEAEEIFSRNPDSIVIFAAHSFSVLMDAVLSFEDEKLTKALATLKEVEKKCAMESGWLKHVSQKVFGTTETKTPESLADKLEMQIILADSQVCIAILTFLQQDIAGYLKSGWVLRKAWKVYQRVYKEILNLYKENIGELHLPDPAHALLMSIEPQPESASSATSAWDVPESLTNGENEKIEKEAIIRLMGAVSFGYGLFQLGISLLPPSLMRLINILGFSADRQNGISSLMYARLGTDMRSPLATLALLWYHTIVRPFYVIDGTDVRAGVEASLFLLQESEKEFQHSPLFLFFRGRICRLEADIQGALNAFQSAVDNTKQRELKILCTHEIGWCHLIRWSSAFYAYLAALNAGALGDYSQHGLFGDLRNLSVGALRGTTLDEFLTKRCKRCPCDSPTIDIIIKDCQLTDQNDEPMPGLSKLILGCALCNRGLQYDALKPFRECMDMRKNVALDSYDAHVSAFCQYELGALLLRDEQTRAEGRLLLQKMAQYGKYDFDNKLNVRVYSLLRQHG